VYDGREEEVAVEVSNGRRGNNPNFSRLAGPGLGGIVTAQTSCARSALVVTETGHAKDSSPVIATSHPRGYALLVGRDV
jgi:hypothetical protein